MMKFAHIFLLASYLVSCGQHSSNSSTAPIEAFGQDTSISARPSTVDPQDFVPISKLRPTTYYLPDEKLISCAGKYGGKTYDGSERSDILGLDGKIIATVCTRFYSTLLMEGSAIIKDRGQGEFTINYGGIVEGTKRFHLVERCIFGEGIKRDLCLLPYHTIAADNKIHEIGNIIFVPDAEGLILPDGSKHEGFFIVRDTGSAFNGIGAQRVDMFTGIDPDNRNVFSAAGFDKEKPMSAYKIIGKSAEEIKLRLKNKFGPLY